MKRPSYGKWIFVGRLLLYQVCCSMFVYGYTDTILNHDLAVKDIAVLIKLLFLSIRKLTI